MHLNWISFEDCLNEILVFCCPKHEKEIFIPYHQYLTNVITIIWGFFGILTTEVLEEVLEEVCDGVLDKVTG